MSRAIGYGFEHKKTEKGTSQTQSSNKTQDESELSTGIARQEALARKLCELKNRHNSRTLGLLEQIRAEQSKAQREQRGYEKRVDLKQLLSTTYKTVEGDSLQKGRTVSHVVKGFRKSFMASGTVKELTNFFRATSGYVKIAQAYQRLYGAIMESHVMPAFDENFIKEIQELHTLTMLVT